MTKSTWPIDPNAPIEIKVKASHEGATLIRVGGTYVDGLILRTIRERINLIRK